MRRLMTILTLAVTLAACGVGVDGDFDETAEAQAELRYSRRPPPQPTIVATYPAPTTYDGRYVELRADGSYSNATGNFDGSRVYVTHLASGTLFIPFDSYLSKITSAGVEVDSTGKAFVFANYADGTKKRREVSTFAPADLECRTISCL